jgi:beta-lactamase regulating signal transducer with metallopeptidase domain
MTFDKLVTDTLIQALGWTLAHFLWQGTAVALLLAAVNAALRRSSANARYFASCAALLLMLALPLITFWVVSRSSLDLVLAEVDIVLPESHESLSTNPPQFDSLPRFSKQSQPVAPPLEPSISITSQAAPLRTLSTLASENLSGVMPWLTSLWFAGVVLLSLRMMGGWLYTWRLLSRRTSMLGDEWQQMLRRLCEQLRLSRPVRLVESALVQVPTAIGWLRPMILIPASAIAGLTPRQLEAIIAHELAHIRRYDYLVNLIQTAVEILLFYHPAVWWVSRQARIEREHCCDDVAVEVCGDVLTYARALSEIEELRSQAPRLAMAANGGVLLGRIQRLLGTAPRSPYEPAPWMGALVAFALVFILAAGSRTDIFSTAAQPIDLIEERAAIALSKKFGGNDHLSASNKLFEVKSPEKTEKELEITLQKPEVAERGEIQAQAEGNGSLLVVAGTESIIVAAPVQSQGGSYIEELTALGYTGLTVDQLIELKNSGVTPGFIKEMKSAGYGNLKIEELIHLTRQGVSAKYVVAMKDVGFENLTVQEIIRMRSQAVSPEFAKGLKETFKDVTTEQVIRAASQAITLEYVKNMRAAGYTDVSLNDLIRARSHAVGPEYVKGLREKGFDNLKLDQVISIRNQGITSDYLKEMQSLGFANLKIEDIVRAANNGVRPQYIRDIRDLGYTNASFEQIIRMRNNGVSVEYVKGLREAGYNKLDVEQVIRMRNSGVSIDYIKNLKQAGYDRLTVEEVIRLRNHGVTAEFIKKAKAQGIQNLSVDQLIRLRNAGIF